MANVIDPALYDAIGWIRLALGDAETGAYLLDDSVIEFALRHQAFTPAGLPVNALVAQKRATLELARHLVATKSQDPTRFSRGSGGGTISYQSRLVGWDALIKRLELEGLTPLGMRAIRSSRSRLPSTSEFG
jgi:hypothetical protein